jgi:hypothetical protein
MRIGEMNFIRTGFFVFAAAALVGAAPANADIVYQDSTGASQQDWAGRLGMDFQVNGPILVTSLGAFDNGIQSKSLSGEITLDCIVFSA